MTDGPVSTPSNALRARKTSEGLALSGFSWDMALGGKYGLQAGGFKALSRPGLSRGFSPGAPSQARCWPLSSAIICPVTEGLLSRKRTAQHTSSTVAARPSGVARHSRSKSDSGERNGFRAKALDLFDETFRLGG